MAYRLIDEEETQPPRPKFRLIEEEPPNVSADVAKQLGKESVAGALGSYGNLLDLFNAQGKENLLPGEQARLALEERYPFLAGLEEETQPSYARLPSSEDISKFIEMLGGPGKAETSQGRIAGRAGQLGGELLE